MNKSKDREQRRWAEIKADPIRAACERERKRDQKRRLVGSAEGLERHRATTRRGIQRLRMTNPEYAAQWERDELGRWFRASQSADGSVTREFIRELEQEQLCPYCLERLTDNNRTFDHVDPIARGGMHTAENLTACCASCNIAKGKLRVIEFLYRRSCVAAAA